MINLDPALIIKNKIRHLSWAALLGGFIFILLGVGIIFVPQIIQYIFVVAFILIGLLLFTISIKLDHLADLVSRFEIFGLGKIKKR